MAKPQDEYCSIFTSRYRSDARLLKLFSDQTKFETWRRLWIWLAESEKELGLQITDQQIAELKAHVSEIDWDFVAAREKETRHDVMAHIHAYKALCPNAAGIIHLGATSCFVQDNTDLILIRDGLQIILPKLARCVDRLATFAQKHIDRATLGRTHYQAASVTTVGKRATLWIQDLLMALEQLEVAAKNLRFRGIKGATGTQDSFLKLFDGDKQKVKKLNEIVTKKAGFERSFLVTGQTYPRLQDAVLLNAFATLGAAIHKVCTDIRLLQANREIQEPFGEHQVGSSAMPYKKNPIRSERCCGFARHLMALAQDGLQTAAVQGFERTLDDSSNRRISIPDAFLTADVILETFQNVAEGLIVHEQVIQSHVMEELPFLAMETVLMELAKKGKDRQECHEKIREVTLQASERVSRGEPPNVADQLKTDPFFKDIQDRLPNLLDASLYIGLCPEQVKDFIAEEVKPVLEKYKKDLTGKSELSV